MCTLNVYKTSKAKVQDILTDFCTDNNLLITTFIRKKKIVQLHHQYFDRPLFVNT